MSRAFADLTIFVDEVKLRSLSWPRCFFLSYVVVLLAAKESLE